VVTIKTNRLLIRNFVPADWEDLRALAVDKGSSEYAAYDYALPATENEIKAITGWFAREDQYLAVCESTHQYFIGFVSLGGENPRERDLGYTFHSRYHGLGYASEACTALIDYAFDVLNLERIHSGTANLNFPSVKLLLSLAFEKTGEQPVAFNKTTEGDPVEFTGGTYRLEKAAWLQKRHTQNN
jgi:[ribosomal protein S5]-alanine N-acetyltransferase